MCMCGLWVTSSCDHTIFLKHSFCVCNYTEVSGFRNTIFSMVPALVNVNYFTIRLASCAGLLEHTDYILTTTSYSLAKGTRKEGRGSDKNNMQVPHAKIRKTKAKPLPVKTICPELKYIYVLS